MVTSEKNDFGDEVAQRGRRKSHIRIKDAKICVAKYRTRNAYLYIQITQVS